MKKMIAVLAVLCLASAAMATPMVAAQIYYPDATSWQLYLTEVDSAAPTVPSGFGIAGFAVGIIGALPGTGNSNCDGEWALNSGAVKQGTTGKGTYGWATIGSPDVNASGYVQALAGVDTSNWGNLQNYGYGVQAGQYKANTANIPYGTFTPGSTWKLNGVALNTTYSAPSLETWSSADGMLSGVEGLYMPGVCVWAGLRPADGVVTLVAAANDRNANVFTDTTGTAVQAPVVLVPEPATLALLGLGALAAMRRRRA